MEHNVTVTMCRSVVRWTAYCPVRSRCTCYVGPYCRTPATSSDISACVVTTHQSNERTLD